MLAEKWGGGFCRMGPWPTNPSLLFYEENRKEDLGLTQFPDYQLLDILMMLVDNMWGHLQILALLSCLLFVSVVLLQARLFYLGQVTFVCYSVGWKYSLKY